VLTDRRTAGPSENGMPPSRILRCWRHKCI